MRPAPARAMEPSLLGSRLSGVTTTLTLPLAGPQDAWLGEMSSLRRCGLEGMCTPAPWRRDDSSTLIIGWRARRPGAGRLECMASDPACRPQSSSSPGRPAIAGCAGSEREASRTKPPEPRLRHRAALRMRDRTLSGDLSCRRRPSPGNRRLLHRRPCPPQRRHSAQSRRPLLRHREKRKTVTAQLDRVAIPAF
jgi:hypothetical protein